MKITYIHHSSFSVELERAVFLFDYYEGTLPEFPEDKELVVLASHKHHDHFDFRIFSLAERYPKVTYLLSKDIKMSPAYMSRRGVPEKAAAAITYAGKNVSLDLAAGGEPLHVETLASTDEGVAFLLEYEGKRLYHAGDLNWWTWIGETEAEYRDMESRFKEQMAKLAGRVFDAAFVPLDPRQEERYFWGFDYFMRTARAEAAFPMHFWGDHTVISRLLDSVVSEPYRDRIMRIEREGQVFELP